MPDYPPGYTEVYPEERIGQIDWSKVLIRCSSLSALFTEPKSAEDKKNGELSETAKGHLIEVYASEFWGVETEITATAVRKGLLCEDEAITTLSRLDKRLYVKNEERKSNEWITGECDIDNEPDDEIVDTKVSLSATSFLSNLTKKPEKDHIIQLNGYMWLWGRNRARIAHVLCDMPESLIEGEKYQLLRAMDVATEESPDFKKAWAKRLTALKFSHLPIEQRVLCHQLYRDESIIEKIPGKITKAREYLQFIHEKHISQIQNQ